MTHSYRYKALKSRNGIHKKYQRALLVSRGQRSQVLSFDLRYNRAGEGVGGGEDVIMFEELLKRNLPIYYQPGMAVLHSVDVWKLKRRYFINLHFVSGKKYGQYEMKSFNCNVLGVPPFMLVHFVRHALLAASMFIRGESGSIRQAMNASHSFGSIWGMYLSWKNQRIQS